MLTTYPKLTNKEKVSITLVDELNGIKNDITDAKALVRLLGEFFENGERHLINEYEALNETIELRLNLIQEHLQDLTTNYLDTKK